MNSQARREEENKRHKKKTEASINTCQQVEFLYCWEITMDDINTIKRLNNTAATSLSDGDLDTALSVLHVALQDLRLDLVQGNGTAPGEDGPAIRPALDPLNVPLHHSLCFSDLCVSPNNAFHVFTKAFILPESENDLEAVSMVILYNFGLVLQRKAVMTGEERSFLKALKIYIMAADLLEMMQDHGRMASQLLALALWNNLGHSHSHFLNQEKVRECEIHMRYHLSRENELASEDLVFFHHAMLFLDTCNIASRAAAA